MKPKTMLFCLAIIPKFLIIYSNYFSVQSCTLTLIFCCLTNSLKFRKCFFRWFLGKLESEMRAI